MIDRVWEIIRKAPWLYRHTYNVLGLVMVTLCSKLDSNCPLPKIKVLRVNSHLVRGCLEVWRAPIEQLNFFLQKWLRRYWDFASSWHSWTSTAKHQCPVCLILNFNPSLVTVKVELHAKFQGQRSSGSRCRAQTHTHKPPNGQKTKPYLTHWRSCFKVRCLLFNLVGTTSQSKLAMEIHESTWTFMEFHG